MPVLDRVEVDVVDMATQVVVTDQIFPIPALSDSTFRCWRCRRDDETPSRSTSLSAHSHRYRGGSNWEIIAGTCVEDERTTTPNSSWPLAVTPGFTCSVRYRWAKDIPP